MDIYTWLKSIGLERYHPTFEDNDIDAGLLAGLTSRDLIEMGINSLGHRKRLLEAIAALSETSAPETDRALERRQLSILFCDITDFTRLSETMDPEDMRDFVQSYQTLCKRVVAENGGEITNFVGDAVLAQFGYPLAAEDAAMRAVRSGLELTRGVADLDVSVRARAGIETGLVVVGDNRSDLVFGESSVVGEIPNRAARFQALAEPGAVLIGETTRRLVQGAFDLRDRGLHEVRGLQAPAHLWQVLGQTSAQGPVAFDDGELIGRDDLMNRVLRHWRDSVAGQGKVLLLRGDAGIGKSRFARAVAQDLTAQGAEVLRLSGWQMYSSTGFHSLTRHISERAHLAADDDTAARAVKIETLLRLGAQAPLARQLAQMSFTNADAPPAMEPEDFRAELPDAWIADIEARAADNPVLVLVDDAQWMDASSHNVLKELIDRCHDKPVLVCILARSDWDTDWPEVATVEALDLPRLSRVDALALATRIAGDADVPERVLLQIADRADGVPFYVEELTRAFLETGDSDGAVPATLFDSLMARLDRLGPARAEALTAACIGRHFTLDLLKDISDSPPHVVDEAVDRLVAASLIEPVRSVNGAAGYAFRQALIRETAYDVNLKRRRKEVHTKIATLLEDGQHASRPSIIAFHFEAAGFDEKAVTYWHQSAEGQVGVGAYVEAISQLERALGLIEGISERSEALRRKELQVLVTLGSSLLAVSPQASDEVGALYNRAYALSRGVGMSAELGPVLFGLSVHYFFRGELSRTYDVCEQLFELGAMTQDLGTRIGSHLMRNQESFWRARHDDVRHHSDALDGLIKQLPEGRPDMARYAQDPTVTARICGVWSLNVTGEMERAEAEAQYAMRHALEIRHPFSLAMAHQMMGWHRIMRREADAALTAARTMLTIAEEQGLSMLIGIGLSLQGWALAHTNTGAPAQAPQMLQGLDIAIGMNAQLGVNATAALVAETALVEQDPETGLQALEKAMVPGRSEDLVYLPELHRLRALLNLHQGQDIDLVRKDLTLACDLAREHGSAFFNLRAANALARLTDAPEDWQAAQALTRQIKGGAHLADLREAEPGNTTLFKRETRRA